ncbi:MAG: NUDIX domain-containing protein [Nocardioidaceae bacterium]
MTDVSELAVVVGAAIVTDGRLLAARRVAPPSLAGGWEFPGGKVDPQETAAEACVREVREELGCEIEVVGHLPGEQPLRPGCVLRVFQARLVDGEPWPQEHDAVRWLAPEELDSVPWLAADRPFLDDLRSLMLDGEPLPGGNVGGAVRIGATVRRPTGSWTPAVHALLDHLQSRGLDCVPRVLGYDERGREVLTHLPGDVVYTPRQRMDDEQLADLMRWLRRFHQASASFRPDSALRWRFEERELADDEIICHHDVGWYNLAFTGSRLTGVFDWDVAGPGIPLDDLAFAAWNDVPLVRLPEDAADRLRLMARAYGDLDAADILARVTPRIQASRRRIVAAAEAGDPGMRRLLGTDVLTRIDNGLDALRRATPAIEAALVSSAP